LFLYWLSCGKIHIVGGDKMQNVNTRKLAYKILMSLDESREVSDKVINDYLKKNNLDKRDENLVRKIVYGCLENKLLLNYYIGKVASQSFSKLDKEIVYILQIGMYQILFLDKIPDSAAVNESVKIAKKVNFKTSGFVNGVLRSFIRQIDQLSISQDDLIEYLSITYSYPKWLVNYFIDLYGQKETEAIFKFNKKPPVLSIRVNTLKTTREDLLSELKRLGMSVETSKLTDTGVLIHDLNGLSIDSLELFEKGYFYIQDDASILVSEILNPKAGEKVLDVCAAPGGKSTHIAQLINDEGFILARDVSTSKLSYIKENIKRLGIHSIQTEIFDGTTLDQEHQASFDKILVDAPCSGLGIIRRKPEIKYNRSLEELKSISNLQYKILVESAKLLKDKGTLVYSTCTIGTLENQDVINKFLSKYGNFDIIKIDGKDYLQILPGDYASDGFFICKLTKK
jgi:16S rRNA (cytosine967-C5)-methyltransferase